MSRAPSSEDSEHAGFRDVISYALMIMPEFLDHVSTIVTEISRTLLDPEAETDAQTIGPCLHRCINVVEKMRMVLEAGQMLLYPETVITDDEFR